MDNVLSQPNAHVSALWEDPKGSHAGTGLICKPHRKASGCHLLCTTQNIRRPIWLLPPQLRIVEMSEGADDAVQKKNAVPKPDTYFNYHNLTSCANTPTSYHS